jgi:hypothetical protein
VPGCDLNNKEGQFPEIVVLAKVGDCYLYTAQRRFAGFQPIWAPWLNQQHLDNPEIQPQIFVFPAREYAEISPLAGERIEALKNLLDGEQRQRSGWQAAATSNLRRGTLYGSGS